MKRIIAPIALALLSTVAVADNYGNTSLLPILKIENYSDVLPMWNKTNYKNFTKENLAFFNPTDCVTARDYAMTQINGTLVTNIRSDVFSIIRAVDHINNIETRISCELVMSDKWYSITSFNLVYETATKRSDNEINEIEMKQFEWYGKSYHENLIKSRVDIMINRKTLGTSYKLYEPKNSTVVQPTSKVSLRYHF